MFRHVFVLLPIVILAGMHHSPKSSTDDEAKDLASLSGIVVDFEFSQDSEKRQLLLRITNKTSDVIDLRNPADPNVIRFVVSNLSGDIIPPQAVAKVDPGPWKLALKPDEKTTLPLNDLMRLADKKGLCFPHMTKAGLLGHQLVAGFKYRVIAVYRPFGPEEAGVCSCEKIIEIQPAKSTDQKK